MMLIEDDWTCYVETARGIKASIRFMERTVSNKNAHWWLIKYEFFFCCKAAKRETCTIENFYKNCNQVCVWTWLQRVIGFLKFWIVFYLWYTDVTKESHQNIYCKENMDRSVRPISVIYWFFLSALPFCCCVCGHRCLRVIPNCWRIGTKGLKSPPQSVWRTSSYVLNWVLTYVMNLVTMVLVSFLDLVNLVKSSMKWK